MAGPNIRNLPWDDYRKWRPDKTEEGPIRLDPHKEPPPGTLKRTREILRDPFVVIWKLAHPQIGWFVGRLEHQADPDTGAVLADPMVREISTVEYPDDQRIYPLRAGSSRFIGEDGVAERQRDIIKEAHEEWRRKQEALREAEAEAGRPIVMAKRDTHGADNRPVEDRTEARRTFEAAVERAGGDVERLDPADVFVRPGSRRIQPPNLVETMLVREFHQRHGAR